MHALLNPNHYHHLLRVPLRRIVLLGFCTGRKYMSTVKENVWDYPRPPAIEPTTRHLKVIWEDDGKEIVLAETRNAYRILETSHPPTYYLPPADVQFSYFKPTPQKKSYCEWKGVASYYDFHPPNSSTVVPARAWTYSSPNGTQGKYMGIKDHVAFYVGPWRCFVDGEEVKAQPGDFYGGWLTSDIEGKVKGGPGTWGW